MSIAEGHARRARGYIGDRDDVGAHSADGRLVIERIGDTTRAEVDAGVTVRVQPNVGTPGLWDETRVAEGWSGWVDCDPAGAAWRAVDG